MAKIDSAPVICPKGFLKMQVTVVDPPGLHADCSPAAGGAAG